EARTGQTRETRAAWNELQPARLAAEPHEKRIGASHARERVPDREVKRLHLGARAALDREQPRECHQAGDEVTPAHVSTPTPRRPRALARSTPRPRWAGSRLRFAWPPRARRHAPAARRDRGRRCRESAPCRRG